jgi:hypothetical protein
MIIEILGDDDEIEIEICGDMIYYLQQQKVGNDPVQMDIIYQVYENGICY